MVTFYRRVEDEMAAVPGVRVASLTTDLPLDGINAGMLFELAGRPVADPTRRPWAHYQIISPRYFEALGIALLQGRPFSTNDNSGSTPVCIVNEEFVRRYLGGRDAVGERVRVQELRVAPRAPVTREIVGVIRQVKT